MLPTTPTDVAAEAAHGVAFDVSSTVSVYDHEGELRPGFPKAALDHVRGEVARYICRARPATAKDQPELLRHIVGNPFRPYPTPKCWPTTVGQLTQLLLAGEDATGILADALEEAGHSELAEHFRRERSHPKGCWAIQGMLGQVQQPHDVSSADDLEAEPCGITVQYVGWTW